MTDKLTDMEKETVMLISKYFPYSTKQVEKIYVSLDKSFDETISTIKTMLSRNINWSDAVHYFRTVNPHWKTNITLKEIQTVRSTP